MCTLTNSKDPDEMPHDATFYQDLHYLLSPKKPSLKKAIQLLFGKNPSDLILYVQSTIFQLCRDGSTSVEPALSCLAQ